MLLVAAFCSDLYSQLKHTNAFPAKIFVGVSIQLFFPFRGSCQGPLLAGPGKTLSWTAFLPSMPCGWRGKEGGQ